jgi:hypothetical protein
MCFGAIAAIKVLIQMKSSIIFTTNNVADARSIEESIRTGGIVLIMNPFMEGEKCLSMTHAQNGLKGNGKYLPEKISINTRQSKTLFVYTYSGFYFYILNQKHKIVL